jgi:tetratricopeptide (TPR) repeat protein
MRCRSNRFAPGFATMNLAATRSLLVLCLLGAALWWSGCEPREGLLAASEVDEPHYRRGDQLKRAGRNQEALAAFLRVIDKRGGDAPESHLEAGLIYQQHLRDPIAAIYHYRRNLELRPNSPQAELVRQRIEAATKEFARTLPGQPLEGQMQRAELMEVVQRLQQENLQLKDELARLRGVATAVSVPPSTGRATTPGASVPPAGPAPASPPHSRLAADDIPPVPATPIPTPAPNIGPPPGGQTTAAGVLAPPTRPVDGAARVHVVQQGDTLFNLSVRYYGTGSRWREIYAANRDTLRSENDPLRIGMQLRIP